MAPTKPYGFWALGARRTQLLTALPRNDLAWRLKAHVAAPFDGQFSDYSALIRRSHDDDPRLCRFSDGSSELSLVYADSALGTVIRCQFDPPIFTCWRSLAVLCAITALPAALFVGFLARSLVVGIAAPAGLVAAAFAALWAGQSEFWRDEQALLGVVKATLEAHEEAAGEP